ncbi:MAG: YibE/F family protein [Actinomycetota bacterium]|nr:YibE/F family protein [Actinomycetota bacterium]
MAGQSWWDLEEEMEPGQPSSLERLVEDEHRSGRVPAVLAVALALVTIGGMIVLRPSAPPDVDLGFLTVPSTLFDAQVEEVRSGSCEGAASVDCTQVGFRLVEGPDRGELVLEEFPESGSTPVFQQGEVVVLAYQPAAASDFQYYFVDRQRRPTLAWLALVFALAVVALGRLRGLAALVGLVASIVVLLGFVLPAILSGRPPLLVAILGAAAIAYLALYLAHGFTQKTTVALLGTLASLALTAVLSALVVDLARISGFATEEALFLTLAPGQLDIGGLVLGGIVLGALGAIDDVTVTQASAVWELRAAAPAMRSRDLFRAGLRIGRDHIASTVNTLVLAYAGASMPLLVLFVLTGQSLGTIANSELVATEILRTLVGSIGLVAAVPVTTWLAARFAPRSAAGT